MGNQPGSAFPYDVTEAVESYPSGWVLKNGWRVADHHPVSVFVFTSNPNRDNSHGENFLRRFKTLRHPHILNCIEGIEMEGQIFVVTDRVRPLRHTIDTLRKQSAVMSWGLCSIITAVEWLNSNGKIHGNLSMDSIFVDKEGDWKLGGFEFLTDLSNLQASNPFFSAVDRSFIPKYALPPEIERREQIRSPSFPSHAIDAWMMAAFLNSVFSEQKLQDRNQLKQIEAIPQELRDHYKNLIKLQPAQRIKVGSILDSKYFQNPLVETCLFLEEINVKDTYEKERFFLKLPELIGDFPEFFSKYKLLPLLVHSLDFGSAGSIVLGPILKIGKKLTEEEFQQMVAPSILKWFKSPDRLVRINLLNNVASFASLLPVDMINGAIYPAIASGFSDSDHEFRCATVKSILALSPKLNVNTINNHLLKCLGKLQVDPVPLIRAMTTQCVSKIAALLRNETREKVLVAAFSRALRDPHGPSRIAGVTGFRETKQFYALKDCAMHVLPALSYMTVDPNPEVRSVALTCLKDFVQRIEEGQQALPKEEIKGEPNSSAQALISDNTMLGWAINSLSSKILDNTASNITPNTTNASTAAPATNLGSSATLPSPHPAPSSSSVSSSTSSSVSSISSTSGNRPNYNINNKSQDMNSKNNTSTTATTAPTTSSPSIPRTNPTSTSLGRIELQKAQQPQQIVRAIDPNLFNDNSEEEDEFGFGSRASSGFGFSTPSSDPKSVEAHKREWGWEGDEYSGPNTRDSSYNDNDWDKASFINIKTNPTTSFTPQKGNVINKSPLSTRERAESNNREGKPLAEKQSIPNSGWDDDTKWDSAPIKTTPKTATGLSQSPLSRTTPPKSSITSKLKTTENKPSATRQKSTGWDDDFSW